MGWTKKQLLSASFDEIGLAEYVFDLSPDQIDSALFRLNAYVASLKGVNIGWDFSAGLDDEMPLPDYAVRAIFLNHAMEIAPSYGKNVQALTVKNAKDALDTLVNWSADLPPSKVLPQMLSGAGNKRELSVVTAKEEEVLTKKGNELIFE